MTEKEEALRGFAKQFSTIQGELSVLEEAVQVRQQAQATANAAEAQLSELEHKIANRQQALEKLEKDFQTRSEQIRGERAKLLMGLDEKVAARKAQLSDLEEKVVRKSAEHEQLSAALQDLRSRFA